MTSMKELILGASKFEANKVELLAKKEAKSTKPKAAKKKEAKKEDKDGDSNKQSSLQDGSE